MKKAGKTTKNAELIIAEGITEKFYFLSMEDVLEMKPKVRVLKPYNMDELAKAIKQHAAEGYTRIHCLIDMDTKVSTPKTMEKYQRLKRKYHAKCVPNTDCEVRFYESFPSVELFFFYYFEYSTAEKSNNGLKSWLKKKCGNDTTSEKYLSRNSLHGDLRKAGGSLNCAIHNAKDSVRQREADNYHCCYTEMGELIESLGLK